ncbi:MAG TPA: glutathione S-transferase family protein [Gammaproteobacteria bacterium]|nr:glutathione S-transferase family protein [Gammaproteobacteria bacterium]
MSKPELISFDLCPYVQRSVITLREKGVEFDLTYIDLQDKPAWFVKISPFGQVPVLRVGETVLFESAVINEYLDEVNPPSLHPTDPLRKALNRAWIEFGSSLLVDQYRLMTAADEAGFDEQRHSLEAKLQRLEDQLGDGPFFNGPTFSLVDAAYAPLFLRLSLIEQWRTLDLDEDHPKVGAWGEALMARPSTRESVLPDFADRFASYVREHGPYLAGLMGGGATS